MVHKICYRAKNLLLISILQLWSNQADIQVILLTQVLLVTKFHDNRAKFIDFLLIANIKPSSKEPIRLSMTSWQELQETTHVKSYKVDTYFNQRYIQNIFSKMVCPFWSNVAWKNPDGGCQSKSNGFFYESPSTSQFRDSKKLYVCKKTNWNLRWCW